MSEELVIQMKGITKVYPNGTVANQDVNFDVRHHCSKTKYVIGYLNLYVSLISLSLSKFRLHVLQPLYVVPSSSVMISTGFPH